MIAAKGSLHVSESLITFGDFFDALLDHVLDFFDALLDHVLEVFAFLRTWVFVSPSISLLAEAEMAKAERTDMVVDSIIAFIILNLL